MLQLTCVSCFLICHTTPLGDKPCVRQGLVRQLDFCYCGSSLKHAPDPTPEQIATCLGGRHSKCCFLSSEGDTPAKLGWA
ncbi:hypothetical protein GGR58DRAFT_473660, partial [Xylaria digitata]